MQTVYKAILRQNRIEWIGEAPADLPPDQAVAVTVTIQNSAVTEDKDRHKKMMDALEALAARGGIASIPDPVAWQREQRKDRPLPFREQ